MEINIEFPHVFKPILNFDKRFVMLKGGRVSGKTEISCQLAVILTLINPEVTVLVCRDSYSDLRSSSFEQINSTINKYGLDDYYISSIVPMEITNKRNGSNIQFFGIGGSDIHRTKSMKPKNSVIAVIYEELQQVRDQESLEQASSSFRRFLDVDKGVMIHIFNPQPQNNHWLNKFWTQKEKDTDWLCIHSTYMDIVDFINDLDLKEILKLKQYDYTRYEWMYLGKSVGNFGIVYPQFKRQQHLLTWEEANKLVGNEKIVAMIIGGDGAVTNDCTSLIPIAIFSSGRAVVLDIFHHDPHRSGVRSSAELMPYIQIWFGDIIKKYGLGQIGDSYQVPILFKVDSAAPELVRQLQYFLSNRAAVQKFNKPTILEMVDITQASIAKNMVYIIDFGGYKDYVRNEWIKEDNPLAYQLEMVQWNERQTGYDPSEPNDDLDAFTYGVNTYYKNPDNLYWLDNLIRSRQTYYEIGGE